MKRIVGIVMLAFFVLAAALGATALAEQKWRDPYEAYGAGPGGQWGDKDANLVHAMRENPPQAVKLRLKSYAPYCYSGAHAYPLGQEIILEQGQSKSISFTVHYDEQVSAGYRRTHQVDLTIYFLPGDKWPHTFIREGGSKDGEIRDNFQEVMPGVWSGEVIEDAKKIGGLYWELDVHMTGSDYHYIPEALTSAWVDIEPFDYPGSVSQTYADHVCLCEYAIYYELEGVVLQKGPASIIDTFASGTAGETGVAVPAAIAAGLAGLLAAAAGAAAGGAGAAAGGGGGDGRNGEEAGSSYKMYLQKDFGNRIRRGGKHVFLYARMAELKSDGSEVMRPDLTSEIEIFSPDAHISVGPATLSGDYMAASVQADYFDVGGPEKGVVSFKFTGEGGVFQNNVTFTLVGDAQIRVEDVWLLDSEEETSAELPFRLLDFLSTEELEIDFTMKEEGLPFDLELDYSGGEEGTLLIRKGGSPVRMKELIRGYMGTLTARAGEEEVEETFVVRLCREGIYLDFDLDYGEESGKAELKCYPDAEGEMITNRVGIGILIWDEEDKRPRMVPPAELEVKSEDEKSIGERIGLLWESTGRTVTGKKMTDERLSLWQVQARKLLPYLEPVPTTLQVQAQHEEREFAEEFTVKLMPDLSAYFDEYERQFKHLWDLMNDAFSAEFATSYHSKLNQIYNRFGLDDLQRAEKSFRKIIQYELERMAIEQSMVCDNYDNIIGVLEWTEWLGGICTDILLTIFTGPMGTFLVSNAKDLLVETVKAYVERPELGPLDLLWLSGEVLVKNTMGSLDNLADFPKPEQWSAKELKTYAPKLAIWVSLFFVYRVIFHYYYDRDENDERNLYEAVKAAGWDLTVKATLELFLQEYLSRAGQSDRVFGKEMKGAKEIAAMDAETFGKVRDDFVGAILEYIKQLKAGLDF